MQKSLFTYDLQEIIHLRKDRQLFARFQNCLVLWRMRLLCEWVDIAVLKKILNRGRDDSILK